MDSRERVIRAIERTGPDRVPITHAILPGAYARYGPALERFLQRYPADVDMVGAASEGEYGPEIGVPSRDSWGALWLRHTDEHKGQVVHHPLADWDDVPGYTPPDTAGDAALAEMEGRIAAAEGRYALADGDTLWQRMFYLHGYAATLEDLLVHPERCAALRDLILRVMLRRIERLAGLSGLDGVQFRDDWGTQTALMIAPPLWRRFFKPAYARLVERARDGGLHVWFHSDGAIAEIIPDLLEIGVQVLNPQVGTIGRERLTELVAGRACIEGDIDRQQLLPFGAPEQVRAAVRADIDAFGGHGGGYIARGEIAGDVPLRNAEALYGEAIRYRSAGLS